jgi:hypothetical protein
MLRLVMFQQLAAQYAALLEGWDGHLRVDTVHGDGYDLDPSHVVGLSEVGILINWGTSTPDGVLVPWSEVTALRQIPGPDRGGQRHRKGGAG